MEVLKSRPDITSLIKTLSEEQGIDNYVISDVQTNQKGEGYLGQIFIVTVRDSSEDKRIEMVIKAAFTDDAIRDMVPIRMSFQNEIYFYKNVLPAFEKLEEKCGISRIRFVPRCYKVSLEQHEEMLILENLKSSGFEIFDKTSVLDDDHVRLIFKTYGRFHGYSFVLRDQKPELYNELTRNMYNIYEEFTKNTAFSQHLEELGKTVQKTLIPEEDAEIMEKYKSYSGDAMVNIFNNLIKSNNEKYSAILHGDCWSNNMMFKYEETPCRKPIDMRLIDWQIIKVGSPVCDLSYCLYSGASKKVFDHLNEYLRIYHDSFSSLVKALGSDPEKLFPFSALKDEWKKYSRFGMIMAFQILRMKLTNKEDIVDLTDGYNMEEFTEVLAKQKFDEKNYNKRIRGLLWHMSEVGAL